MKETEEDIQNNRKSTAVYDKVRGSNPEFPYQPQSFSVQGIVEEDLDGEEEKILQERKLNAKRLKVRAEKAINAAPVRMQRIIRFRIILWFWYNANSDSRPNSDSRSNSGA